MRDIDADKVDQLWSTHEIQQLAYRFALAHDSRDMAEMERIFVEADTPPPIPELNLATVRQTMGEYWRTAGPTLLFVGNHIINLIDRDHAEGSVYCLCKLDIAGTWIEAPVFYQDQYERRDGSWRFTKRRHLLWYGIELPQRPFDQPKTNWPISPLGRGSVPEDFRTWREFYGIAEPPTGYYFQPGAEPPSS